MAAEWRTGYERYGRPLEGYSRLSSRTEDAV